MNNKIEQTLAEALGITDKSSPADNFTEITNHINELNEILSQMSTLRNKYRTVVFSEWEENLRKSFPR